MAVKIIRDNLHGYISIPKIIFSEIIDTPIFQRLKRIEQTSMRPLYPGARHDRFVHSLGVYHLGEKAVSGLIKNIAENDKYYSDEQRIIWCEYEVLFKIACLLHDCGHSPFSHSFEKYYLGSRHSGSGRWEQIREYLQNSLNNIDCGKLQRIENTFYAEDIKLLFNDSDRDPVPHEVYSAIVVAKYFSLQVKSVYEGHVGNDRNHDDKFHNFSIDHIEFIQRAILGMQYNIEKLDEKQRDKYNILNCLIQLLNSRSFDVDKLDYIMRDSMVAGVKNLAIDVERILGALTIIEIHNFDVETSIKNEYIDNSGVLILGMSDEKVCTGLDECQKCELNISLKNIKISGDLIGSVSIKKGNLNLKNNEDGNEWGDNSKYEFKNKESVEGTFFDGQIVGSFVGELSADKTDNQIDGFLKCKINGTIKKGTIIGNIDEWKVKRDTRYIIGYKKSALSVIEDTITARNRLYVWIYGHHKVTYIDYLLRNSVLVSYLDNAKVLTLDNLEKAKNKLEGVLNINIFDKKDANYLLDDSDFIYKIKKTIDTNIFAEKYLGRSKEYTFWKSYAEYNMFFVDMTTNEKIKLWNLLFNKEEEEDISKTEGDNKMFINSILNEYKEKTEFVWIKPSGYKISKINTKETYLDFNNSIRRLEDVMLRTKTSEEYVGKYFFYLYASREFEYFEKIELIDFLKSKVRKTS